VQRLKPSFIHSNLEAALCSNSPVVQTAATPHAMLFESRFLFIPSRKIVGSPADHGLAFQDIVRVTTDGLRIHGWLLMPDLEPNTEPDAWVLYSHGNAGNLSSRPVVVAPLVRRGIAVLLYDYRGYGRSEGKPTEQGTYLDAEAMLRELFSRSPEPRRVFLYGRSLGGAVSHEMALRHPEVGGLISDATFTSVPDLARVLIPIPGIERFVRARYDNLAKARVIKIPRLVMHGTRDKLIPFSMSERLRDCTEPKAAFHAIEGAGHNDTYRLGGSEYADTICKFIHACR